MTDSKEKEQLKEANRTLSRRSFLRVSLLWSLGLLLVPQQLACVATTNEKEVSPQPRLIPEGSSGPHEQATPLSRKLSTVILKFENDVSEFDRQVITKSLMMAEDYFTALGVKVSRPSYMKVQRGNYYPGTSAGGGRNYEYYWQTYSDGWLNADEKFRQRSLIHEYTHMVQDDLMQSENSRDLVPIWLNEGSAEVLSEDVLIKNGVMTFDEVKQLRLPYYYQGGKVLPLKAYGLADVRNPVPVTWEAYNMSSLAVRYLIGNSNIQALTDLYSQIHPSNGNWQVAFEKVFGMTADNFYQKFELLRQQGLSPLDIPTK